MKRIKRWLACLCALMLLAIPVAQGVEVTLSFPAAPGEAPQVVRVLLGRLGITDRLDATLSGSYSVEFGENSLVFERGSEIAVLMQGGRLALHYQGMRLDCGPELVLLRHGAAAGAENGLRFANNLSLYEGDLRITAGEEKMQLVLSLDVEDYLQGVVPFEMSESFPIEALKAQAVAARTYVVSKALSNQKEPYDVVDNTNDQVYRGRRTEYVQAAKAIADTRGVCGFYKGKLAMCYYSASNGGQTDLLENVWDNGADGGYLDMRDDPYDLENPQSKVQSVLIPKKTAEVNESPYGLRLLLSQQLADRLTAQGYDAAPESLRIDSVTALSVDTPKFAEPSRLMTRLHITFTYSARTRTDPVATASASVSATPAPTVTASQRSSLAEDGDEEVSLYTKAPTPSPAPVQPSAEAAVTLAPAPSPTPAPSYGPFVAAKESVTLDIPIFPDAEKALSLGINSYDNELITVVEDETNFTVESRRFGHGVGLSQRGAEWMAFRYAMTFTDILAFYYPGMTLMQYAETPAALPTVAPGLQQTAGPAPTPTPRPTLMPVTEALPAGAWYATVTEIDDDSSLNLRLTPDSNAEILMKLYKYQRLLVLEACPQEGWVHVRTDAIEGYVMEKFLTKDEEAAAT